MVRIMKEQKGPENKKGFTTTQIILITGFVCVIAVIFAVGFFIYKSMQSQPQESAATGSLVVDESNLESITQDMQSRVDDSMFETNMNVVWNFPDGESPSDDAYVANAGSNHYAISFDVLLDGTEVIFTSGVIPVGKRIKEIKLDRNLPAGSYEAVCMYHLLREDGTENSSFGVNIYLNINN